MKANVATTAGSFSATALLGLGMLLAGNVFAAKPVTQAELDAAIAQEVIDRNNAISAAVPVHAVGDLYQGGTIVYLEDNGQHGLIVATHDINPLDQNGQKIGVPAKLNVCCNFGANDAGLYGGEANTALIIARQGNGLYAAKLAADYNVKADGSTPCTFDAGRIYGGFDVELGSEVCYGGWYLPSNFEMYLVGKAVQAGKVTVDPLALYWVSTQNTVNGDQNTMLVPYGYQNASIQPTTDTLDNGQPMLVRAVRRF